MGVTSAEPVLEEDAVWLGEGRPVVLAVFDELMLKKEAVVGVGEALRRVAMLRPRKVMAERVASASPASHSVNS